MTKSLSFASDLGKAGATVAVCGRNAPEAGADWKLHAEDVAAVVLHLLSHPARSLPSRVEIRPAQPPRK